MNVNHEMTTMHPNVSFGEALPFRHSEVCANLAQELIKNVDRISRDPQSISTAYSETIHRWNTHEETLDVERVDGNHPDIRRQIGDEIETSGMEHLHRATHERQERNLHLAISGLSFASEPFLILGEYGLALLAKNVINSSSSAVSIGGTVGSFLGVAADGVGIGLTGWKGYQWGKMALRAHQAAKMFDLHAETLQAMARQIKTPAPESV